MTDGLSAATSIKAVEVKFSGQMVTAIRLLEQGLAG